MRSNEALEEALAAAAGSPTPKARDRVRREFLATSVCIGCREPVNVSGPLLEDLQVAMLTAIAPEGRVLLVFTSDEQLRKRSPAAHPVWLEARTALAVVERDGLAGVTINPAGPWVFLPMADLEGAPADTTPR